MLSVLFCRYLADSNSRMGREQIANCYVFEEDKKKALNILYTVSSLFPLSSTRQRFSYDDCLEDKREYCQNCSVLYCLPQFCTIIQTLL